MDEKNQKGLLALCIYSFVGTQDDYGTGNTWKDPKEAVNEKGLFAVLCSSGKEND